MATTKRDESPTATSKETGTTLNDMASTLASSELEASRKASPVQDFHVPSQPPVFPEGGLRAWAVAAGASAVLFCTFGYINAFGVFEEYFLTHQLRHRSASDISWIGSFQTFFLFAGSLIGGPLFDRYGGKTIYPSAVLYLFSVFMTSICKSYYQFMLASGILGGFSAGLCFAPAMAATGQYFLKKRGAAMGLAVAGSSIGGVIFPIMLSRLLYNTSLSFGWSVRICGFLMLGLLIPAALTIKARLPPREGRFFLISAFKEPLYLAVIASIFLILCGVFQPIFYLPTYAVSRGMDPTLASYLSAILNGASFFGRVIPGILADKLGRLNMFFCAGLSTAILIFVWPVITSNAGVIVFSAFFGFCSGAIVSLMAAAIASVPKNPGDIGTYMGQGMAIVAFGALIGPPVGGAMYSRYHGFSQVSIFSGVVSLAGAFIVPLAKYFTEAGVMGKV